ncbi:PREDICTED: uncharacterized protein At5g41620-like isoform X2 [Ipomoea nil]|uniref:uncharacterized protein At5g41620-like isoform X2 n=1 Tax=Ipomoea nil TaxID=35883 RepID=UPI0009014D7B|nr:PREDICTED: uncharacterized protein At5g41620-like isoform X2 [Ipomoea nil]
MSGDVREREREKKILVEREAPAEREREREMKKRWEQSGEAGPAEKQENLGEKLKKVVKTRGGHSTPVIPFPRLLHLQEQEKKLPAAQDRAFGDPPFDLPCLSSRKLAATLWELHHYNLPVSTMPQGLNNAPPPRLRRLQPPRHDHRPHRHLYEDTRMVEPSDPSPSSPDMSGSPGSLRRRVAASLMQHHRPIERNNHAIQPVSPASYGSSMEITPYNPAMTPSSSIDYKGKITETGYSLKTSTELLKVLNRIWILEEQHASNMSLVKALKKELERAHTRIKEMVRNQQTERHKMDELMKQITEDKLVRKSKEQDWVNGALQSARDELEDERKLRKRSESLHRKLARELHEVKTSFSGVSKELENERNSREVLEELCDEFAWGIRDYEQEFHSLRHKSDRNWTGRTDKDRLILHISESWLDERMQMKLNPKNNGSAVEKLSSEIKTFLETKRTAKPTYRRSSLESIPLNMATSAPRDEGDEDDSSGSDSHCFELQKEAEEHDVEETLNPNYSTPKLASRNKSRSPSNLQVKFQEHMKQGKETEENLAETTSPSKKSGMQHEITEEENSSDRKNKTNGLNSNHVIRDMIKSHYENENSVAPFNPVWRASPVRQWTEKLPSHENEICESSSKLPLECKESTLKAKLLEARARGQRSRSSRLKGSKISL